MKIGILGAGGRMGQMIAKEILNSGHDIILTAAIDGPNSPFVGKDIALLAGLDRPCGVEITTVTQAAYDDCDVLIDFSAPAASMQHAELAAVHRKKLVIGTTGLGEVEEAALKAAAQQTAILYAANMSLGVNLLAALVEQAAQRLSDEYDIEIFEAHHRNKVDAPSGTALLLGEAAAKGRGVSLDAAMVPARFGQIGARVKGSIGISVFRGGDVVGDHSVTFAGIGERIELSHKASDRALFAKGAVRAARWIQDKEKGLYSMRDVLAL